MISLFDRAEDTMGKGEKADDKLIVSKMMISLFYSIENTMRKGENAGN